MFKHGCICIHICMYMYINHHHHHHRKVIKANKGVVFGVVLPLIVILRYPPLIPIALRMVFGELYICMYICMYIYTAVVTSTV
jgi:hypothetical protein